MYSKPTLPNRHWQHVPVMCALGAESDQTTSAMQTLLSLGEPSSTGASVIELVAGAAEDDASAGFAQYFAPAELGQLLDLERRAVVHAKASEQH